MLQQYLHGSQSAQNESESESESGSEEEQEYGQPVFLQRRDAGRQCAGSAASYHGPQPAMANYFAHLTDQYNRSLALDGHAYPMSSYPNPQPNGRTNTNHQVHYITNKYIGYPTISKLSTPKNGKDKQGYAYNKSNRVINGSSLPSTPKVGKEDYSYAYYDSNQGNNGSLKPFTPNKGKEEHGYAYYESNQVNNGRMGQFGNNNNDSSYSSQEDFTFPSSSIVMVPIT